MAQEKMSSATRCHLLLPSRGLATCAAALHWVPGTGPPREPSSTLLFTRTIPQDFFLLVVLSLTPGIAAHAGAVVGEDMGQSQRRRQREGSQSIPCAHWEGWCC